jgi:hypothetical protein
MWGGSGCAQADVPMAQKTAKPTNKGQRQGFMAYSLSVDCEFQVLGERQE